MINRSGTKKALSLMTKDELREALTQAGSGANGWTVEDRLEYARMINNEIRSRIRRYTEPAKYGL